jgi:uncharacterized protein
MFNIVQTDTLPAFPWKNGGGVTREIARLEEHGALIWRISLADVATDGPFSRFDGLTRILTVTQGVGIALHSPDGVVTALPGNPVRFSGDLVVEGRLIDGPIRDLNVIFDPTRINADVRHISTIGQVTTGPALTGFLVISGPVMANDAPLPKGAFALGTTGTIDLGPGASGLLISLHSLS